MTNNMSAQFTTDDVLGRLHDKATRGELMTAEEENALLNSSYSPAPDALRDEVKKTLMHLEVTAQQVRAQAEENGVLRQDIAALLIGFAV